MRIIRFLTFLQKTLTRLTSLGCIVFAANFEVEIEEAETMTDDNNFIDVEITRFLA